MKTQKQGLRIEKAREKRRSTQNKIQMSKNGRALIQNRYRCQGEKEQQNSEQR
jgi:hypothetical protein